MGLREAQTSTPYQSGMVGLHPASLVSQVGSAARGVYYLVHL